MKTAFRNIGILALACFSFLITDETITVVKESDQLMVEIKEKATDYFVQGMNGKIDDKYIKLGYDGLEIDSLKSYNQMKKIGYFNENMIIYKHIKPEISISNNKDKIINSNFRNEVVLLFKNPDNIDKIINILRNNNINASFLISKAYYLNNFESIEDAISYNNSIVISEEEPFFKNELVNNYFCYSSLNKCSTYLVEESLRINNFKDLKNNLTKGSIILINNSNYLDIYLKYILSKGINIVDLKAFTKE